MIAQCSVWSITPPADSPGDSGDDPTVVAFAFASSFGLPPATG